MTGPYFSDDTVTLWHGDLRDVLPCGAIEADSCVTDPPYGETVAAWDVWPAGWPDLVGTVLPASASLWCFGSARMFLAHADDFSAWRFAQEQLWVKRNGSGPGSRDRLTKVHEWAYHWYRGRWADLHHEWERVRHLGENRTWQAVDVRSTDAAHRRDYGREGGYVDDGTRQPRSVTHVVESPSVRGRARHQDEKPLAVVLPLVRECTPPGGTVLDVFAGTGTTAVAARMLGLRAVLVEADEAACEVAATRLSEDDLLSGLVATS